jgi:dihydrodipicolinate synthase/N-acetylneuraminate lyase
MKFEGIYTPVLTPYDDNHAINFDAIEPMIEDLINSGVHGLSLLEQLASTMLRILKSAFR